MIINNYKINKYKLKYYLNPKEIYLKKLKYYTKNMHGGNNVFNYFTLGLINKHKVLFPESKEDYDKYFESISQDTDYDINGDEFIKLIEKYEYRIIEIPQYRILEKGTILYHLSPNQLRNEDDSNKDGYPNKDGNFFSDSLDGIYKYILPSKRSEGFKDKLYLYEYELKEDILLIHTNFNYNIYNLESFFEHIDNTYERQFNMRGIGDNVEISSWLSNNMNMIKEKNGNIEYKGWYEEPSAFPIGSFNEIMLLGDTSNILELKKIKTIESE